VSLDTKIRLSQQDLDSIRISFKNHFTESCHLWIFGSRVNIDARGGDIDLYVETSLTADQVYSKKIDFLVELQDRIGEQKIDVVINQDSSSHLPIYDVAKKNGIQLV
jgi:hypothetical protein